MASDKLNSVLPPQQIHNGLNAHPQLVFQESFVSGQLRCAGATASASATTAADQGTKAASRELTVSFLDHHNHFFQHDTTSQATDFRHQWNANSRCSGEDASEEDEDDDDDDEDDDGNVDKEEEKENNMGNTVTVDKISESSQNERYSAECSRQKMKHISAEGIKEGNNSGELRNTRGGEVYYAKYLDGAEVPSSSSGLHKDMVMENEYGLSGKKESSYFSESGESLRTILSDPITGILMDDAMILPCGHSFGSGGIQQIIRVKACCTCSQPVSEDCITPNLSLRLAVQAFRREEELQVNRASKRKRERYDRDHGAYESTLMDLPRARGVLYPFAVTDRVIIKGNKRTPPRFIGREAIVTTQCLNGWYVVKTLDNAESVKLQYRSLAKVTDIPSAKLLPTKMTPNWL